MTAKPKTRKAPGAPKVATSPSGTAAEAKVCLMEVFKGRDNSEIERIKAFLEVAFPRQPKAEEMEAAASISSDACKMADGRADGNALMLQAAEAGDNPVADLHHEDELDRMKSRLFGLVAMVAGAASFAECDERNGVLQLMDDVADQMEKCTEAFGAMRQLREGKEKAA